MGEKIGLKPIYAVIRCFDSLREIETSMTA